MKKLAIVCPKPPWFNEGEAKVVKEHSLRLAKKFNLEIFCCDPSGKEAGIHNWNNIKVHVYKGFTNAYLFSWKLFKDLKKEEFDIVHVHGFTTFMPLVTSLLKENTSRLIFQPHYHPIGSTFWFDKFRKVYDPIIGNFIINKSDKIICVSNYEKKELEKKYDIKGKVRVLYNGIDTNMFKRVRPFKSRKKIILYVGRLEKYKNIQLIIEAMIFLKDCHFFIIGGGPYKNNLQRLIKKLNLDKNVKLLRNVKDKELRRWYKTCDIFITLSKVESFGLTVIESLAAGKPVIVNYETSLAELSDKFKEVIPVKIKDISIEELAKTIKKNINRKIKVNVNLGEYNWSNIVKEIIGVYNEK